MSPNSKVIIHHYPSWLFLYLSYYHSFVYRGSQLSSSSLVPCHFHCQICSPSLSLSIIWLICRVYFLISAPLAMFLNSMAVTLLNVQKQHTFYLKDTDGWEVVDTQTPPPPLMYHEMELSVFTPWVLPSIPVWKTSRHGQKHC